MPIMGSKGMVLHAQTRKKLLRLSRRSRDANFRTRCLIVLRLSEGWKISRVTKALSCSPATVRDRWTGGGFAGQVDCREDNGWTMADERYTATAR